MVAMNTAALEPRQSEPSAPSRRNTAHAVNGDRLPASRHTHGNAVVYFGRAEDHYAQWPTPTCIIADGPYGVDGFPGNERTPATAAFYAAAVERLDSL